MTEPTADEPNASSTGDDISTEAGVPATIIIVTEEALKPVDVDKIVALHEEESATYRVLVPADTQRNMLSTFLNHLSLFEMREALESLRPVDRDGGARRRADGPRDDAGRVRGARRAGDRRDHR
jgi:hypothetical protein